MLLGGGRRWLRSQGHYDGAAVVKARPLIDPRLLVPWISAGGLFAGATVTYGWFYDVRALPLVLIVMTAMSCALTALAWKLTHERTLLGRVNVTANTAAAFAWLTVATWTGPWTRPTRDVFLLGAVFAAIVWNLRHGTRGENGDEGGANLWSRLWSEKVAPAADLRGSKLSIREVTENRAAGELQLQPGVQTVADVQRQVARVASAMALPPEGVQISPNLSDATKLDMAFVRRDPLVDARVWPGPHAPGTSIMDAPVTIGWFQDGQPSDIWLATEEGARNVQVNGMTGAGKSVFGRVTACEALSRRDVVLWVVDTAKGKQTIGPLAKAADWFAKDTDHARGMFNALVSVIAARADFLGDHGRDNWDPSCFTELGMPFLLVLFEEASELGRDKRFKLTVERARSVGVSVIMSQQRSHSDSINTGARGQFAISLQFGVERLADAYALSEEAMARGANPAAWAQKRKGYCYLGSPELDSVKDVMPMRTFNLLREQLEEVVAARLANPVPLDELSAAAAGKHYQARELTTGAAAADPASPAAVDREQDDDDDAESMVDPDDEQAVAAFLAAQDAELGQQLRPVDPTLPQDLEELPEDRVDVEVAFPSAAQPKVKAPQEEALAALDAAIRELAESGREFGPKDLYHVARQVGWSASWLRGELRRREGAHEIEYSDKWGRYRALAAALV